LLSPPQRHHHYHREGRERVGGREGGLGGGREQARERGSYREGERRPITNILLPSSLGIQPNVFAETL